MKVRFGEIPEEGLRYEIKDESWFPDNDVKRTGPVRSLIELKRNGVDRVLLSGEVQTTFAFDCDRCTESYEHELDTAFKLDLEYVPGPREEPAEHECSSAEMDVIYLKEPVVDLFEVLNQQLFLMVTGRHLCSEACKGLCPMCGANLNLKSCECTKETDSSPFAVLKNRSE